MSKQTGKVDRYRPMRLALACLGCMPLLALADTASDELTISAGLGKALTVSCATPLSLGVIRVPAGPRGGQAHLTVQPNGNLGILSQGSAAIAQVQDSSKGVCAISGTPNACVKVTQVDGGTPPTRVIGPILTLTPRATLGLDAATEGKTLQMQLFAGANNAASVDQAFLLDANGQFTYQFGGDFFIPDNLSREDFGGYGLSITVEFASTDLGDCDSIDD